MPRSKKKQEKLVKPSLGEQKESVSPRVPAGPLQPDVIVVVVAWPHVRLGSHLHALVAHLLEQLRLVRQLVAVLG